MDLLLPKVADSQKAEAHVAFKSYSVKVQKRDVLRRNGFYYVGIKPAIIEKLVGMFERGYASDGLDNLKSELIRTLALEENVIPELILCDAKFEIGAIKRFMQFLRNHPTLSMVPMILDGTGLSDEELRMYRSEVKPDEILFVGDCDVAMFRKKIEFLQRCKTGIRKLDAHKVLKAGEVKFPKSNAHAFGHFLKRCFDVLVSGTALLILSPIMLLIAIAIRLESRGAVFYVAKRAGRGYRIFNFYKFRTMVAGADKQVKELHHLNGYSAEAKGPVFFKINNDPRITRVGKLLRNTSLDELPQLINVFLGDMSLVGNRPLPLYEAATLTTDDYAMRFMAPAGITGLWQVKKRGTKDMSVEERINIDIHYAEKYNFVTDLWIIANTPSALLQKENV